MVMKWISVNHCINTAHCKTFQQTVVKIKSLHSKEAKNGNKNIKIKKFQNPARQTSYLAASCLASKLSGAISSICCLFLLLESCCLHHMWPIDLSFTCIFPQCLPSIYWHTEICIITNAWHTELLSQLTLYPWAGKYDHVTYLVVSFPLSILGKEQIIPSLLYCSCLQNQCLTSEPDRFYCELAL